MDVLNIVINPSEKAERGNGTALPEVPPGAVPGEDTRAGRARPEPSALPQCDWRMAKSDFKFNTVELD